MLSLATLAGLGLEASLARIKPRASPLVLAAAAWLGWGLATALAATTGSLATLVGSHLLPAALFAALAFGLRDLRALEVVAAAVVASTIWVGAVCLHQATRPDTCVALLVDDDPSGPARSDGRPCVAVEDCARGAPDPEATYRCERTGWFDTTTVDGGRVRYVGVLHDPNEAALATALSLPLAVALHRRRRSLPRLALLAACVVAATGTVLASRSRTGALALAALPTIHAIRKRRARLVVGAGLATALLLLVGGRSGERAAASTAERLETWQEGLAMVRAHPLLGVGRGQFTEHHALTAHNAFLLSAAEEGLVGVTLWTLVLTIAGGVSPCVRTSGPGAPSLAPWSAAAGTSIAALAVGAAFLSLNTHVVTWLHLGLAAGVARLGATASSPAPRRLGPSDLALAGVLAGVALLGVAVAARGPP